MARRTRGKIPPRKITLTDTGTELVATMPGPDGAVLRISDSADLRSIRALIKKRQQIGRKIAKIIADNGFPSAKIEVHIEPIESVSKR